MCGIFGYASKTEKDAFEVIHNGLKRLEYRGYDSWGISISTEKGLKTYKTTDGLSKIPEKAVIAGKNGIGHTRWATHGGVTDYNAHPHLSSDGYFVLAQNGIVENFRELKSFLIKNGFTFETETDTEIIVKLIEFHQQKTKTFKDAVFSAFKKLKGRNTIIILTRENTIIAIKNGSPLTIGLGDKKMFFSSDTLSYSNQTKNVIILNDMESVVYENGELKFTDLLSQKVIHKKPENLKYQAEKIDKEGYEHFMLKEIAEQKNSILEATNYTLEELQPALEMIKNNRQIYTVGAGTASFAAGQVAYLLRKIASINAVELKAYEVGSFQNLFSKDSVLIAFSQSGETADTLEAISLAKQKGAKLISLVNMMGSTMTRESDLAYYLRVGPEICVVSTKAFMGKITWGFLLANSLTKNFSGAKKDLSATSQKMSLFIEQQLFSQIKNLAKILIEKEHIFVLGRGQNYYIAQEGALKIKETSYKHAEAFSAGELKHGVIALIEKGTPVICVVSEDKEKPDMLNAAYEIKARGGTVIGFATKNVDVFDHFIKIPNHKNLSFLFNVVPFQLLGYYLSVLQNLNPDKPRNLAKSVTVK